MEPEYPLVLRPPEAGLVLPSMSAGFLSLVLLVLGAAAASLPLCLAGVLLLLLALGAYLYRRGCRLELDPESVTEVTPFSRRRTCWTEGDLLVIRRSRSRRFRILDGGNGLADTAARLQKGSRILFTIPLSWQESRGFPRALSLLESLPLPKKYI